MKHYPKYIYKKSNNKQGFEAVLCRSKEQHEALKKDHFDSPADFGLVTHPNPEEEAEKAAKRAEEAAKKQPKKDA